MVEYTVETIVHLYDSLNSQIESVQNDLNELIHIGFLRDGAKAEIKAARTKAEKRLKKLVSIRDDAEELLNKILKAEVNE